jgi:hypothetical protein
LVVGTVTRGGGATLELAKVSLDEVDVVVLLINLISVIRLLTVDVRVVEAVLVI